MVKAAIYIGSIMKDNFKKALSLVLVHEGGWSDHKDDPGGATMNGVTLETFRRHYGNDRTKHDLRGIAQQQLEHVYKTGYWDVCHCDDMPSGVDYALFDVAVNSGPAKAAKLLQGALGLTQDGVVGFQTLQRAVSLPPTLVIEKLCARRLQFLQGLKTWPVFGKGWSHRVADVQKQAKAMVP